MSAQNIVVMRIFTWIQSQTEFDNVMQRAIPSIGGPLLSKEESKEQVQAFLDVGESISQLFLGFIRTLMTAWNAFINSCAPWLPREPR
jgi:hypothetical protein